MPETKPRHQVTVHSSVDVTRYERDVHDPVDESGFAIVETRLHESFSGGFVGTGIATHLRLERADGSGSLICYERVRGELDGRRGAFLLAASAEMSADHYVHGRWEIVRDSGTEELAGIRG